MVIYEQRRHAIARLDVTIARAIDLLTQLLGVDSIHPDEPINDDLNILEEQSLRRSTKRFPAKSAAEYAIKWVELHVPAGLAHDLLIETLEALRDVVQQVELAL